MASCGEGSNVDPKTSFPNGRPSPRVAWGSHSPRGGLPLRLLALGSSMVGLTAILGAGCSDPAPVTPRSFVYASMGPEANGALKCQLIPQTWLAIGESAKPVNDQGTQGGAPVAVSCAVQADGDGFRVTAQASLSGAGEQSGGITIVGRFTPTGQQKNIKATFQKDVGRFVQADCVVDYRASDTVSVAAGKVRGILSCPTAVDEAKNRTCAASAEFSFENCAR